MTRNKSKLVVLALAGGLCLTTRAGEPQDGLRTAKHLDDVATPKAELIRPEASHIEAVAGPMPAASSGHATQPAGP